MRKHSRVMCLLQRRYRRPFSIHPIPVLYLNRLTRPSRRQHRAHRLQRRAPFQLVRLHRLSMKRPRVQPLGLSKGHRPQIRARSITTDAASQDWALIIAAIPLVFVLLLRSHPRSTGRRSYGGPAFMIMQTVNSGVGVPGMEGIRGAPGITETEEALSIGLRGIVSKRLGSPYRSGRSAHWVKVKNPENASGCARPRLEIAAQHTEVAWA
jgi:hypothetical protein